MKKRLFYVFTSLFLLMSLVVLCSCFQESNSQEHSYEFDSFIWGDDFKSAEAKYICKEDTTLSNIYEASVTSEVIVKPTCTTKGVTKYTAIYDGHIESKEQEDIEALGHKYEFDSFVWNTDFTDAKAKYVCKNDHSHIELYDATLNNEIDTEATCISKGKTKYTANYDNHVDTKVVENIDFIDHDYEVQEVVEPTFETGGYTIFECKVCHNVIRGDEKDKKDVVYTITIDYLDNTIVRVDETGQYTLPTVEKLGYKLSGYVDEDNNDFPMTGTISESKTIKPKWEVTETKTIEQLEEYLANGIEFIKISNDIEIDRTLYVTGKTVIYSEVPITLSRNKDFTKDMFVLGEDKDGNNRLLDFGNCSLDIGILGSENQITIDGNKDNLTSTVVGSVFFIANSSYLNIFDGVKVINNYKTGNEKALDEKYHISSAEKAGGAVALLSNGVMNIYGGEFKYNSVAEENDSVTSSYYGGVIYNNANVNIYGGVFMNNTAGRGGVICNYKICRVYSATIENNHASKYGGAFYLVNSQYAELIIGDTDLPDTSSVKIKDNSSNASGGAIFASTLAAIVIYNNALFTGNSSETGNGGAINCCGVLLDYNSKYLNNSAYSKGGAVYLYYGDSELTRRQSKLTNVHFEGNEANRGGAIGISAAEDTYEYGAIVNFYDCEFIQNSACDKDGTASDMHGGAIYISRKSDVVLNESVFNGNTALGEGGAIYLTGESNLEIVNSNFELNSVTEASSNGGAISLHSSYLTINSTTFSKNSATKNGGAIYNSYTSSSTNESKLIIVDSNFEENSSSNYGGAVYITGRSTDTSNVEIEYSSFHKNTATGNGGAVYITSNSIYLHFVGFDSNVSNSTKYGGGAIYSTGSIIEYDGGELNENVSTYNGGAIALYSQSSATFNSLQFVENQTTNYGGALYINNSSATVYESEFSSNTANNGAGIALYTGGVMNVYSSTFTGNSVTNNGGALYVYTGSEEKSYVCQSKFENNESSNFGGAIYISQASLLSLEENDFKENSALSGGVMYITTTGTTVDIIGITVDSNTATNGSIIYGNTTKATINYSSSLWVDTNVATLDEDYWNAAFANKITANDTSLTKKTVEDYESRENNPTKKPVYNDGISFSTIYNLSLNSSNELIDPAFENYATLNNSSNFQSRTRKTFENINGNDVAVDTFLYESYQPINNPNVGEGLLIWQAILYKNKYPEKEVSIDFTTFHFSIYAALCINRNSRYFGYMYPLHDCEYNEYGFVRISYLLVLAAKMGIKTTVIGQTNAANNKIRDGEGETIIPDASFVEYYSTQLNAKAFDGQPISTYLLFKECKWTSYGDKGATDMMHVKVCAVSNYLDCNGVDHDYATFFSSINLDSLDYEGTNYGNQGYQTATIVSDHEYLYKVTHNYVSLMYNYCEQEDIYLFRDLINKMNAKQIQSLILGEAYDLDTQIVYLGTEDDKVFKLYFTPFGGQTNIWDEVYNPVCNYIKTMTNSDDYVLFMFTSPKFLSYTLSDYYLYMVKKGMEISEDCKTYIGAYLENTIEIEHAEYGPNIYHCKDYFISYQIDDERVYVSILNSLNTHTGSAYYQCNHMLIIVENELSNSIFEYFAHSLSKGYIC